MNLTQFLLARIAEDEASNDAAVAEEVARCRADGMPNLTEAEVRDYWGEQAWWRRRLSECEAKRRIVEREINSRTKITYRRQLVLQDLASIYADHPDYDESWRP